MAAGESVGGSMSSKSESCAHTHAHTLARGGVHQREDWRVDARRSLVDMPRFLLAGRLVVGSPTGDGVITGKVCRKIFPAAEVV